MASTIIVSGTDTGIGKTVFCAGLTRLMDGAYWKPVQAGLEGESDSHTVARLSALPPERILAESYRLNTPASPHWAAELDHLTIDAQALRLPPVDRTLIVEGAGGLLVPLTRSVLTIDVFAQWGAPVVLCARTSLGTLNHTLLSIEALRARGIALLGVAFIGEPHADNERTIAELGGEVLGRLPFITPLNAATLADAFERSFKRESFVLASAR